ncbi:hypothetical protein [Stackebrandtia nassauensis]|uniref:ASCH domain-containing protein n=1 Tax=Stackebrandtia nassauensis (strain DSM 44728 / CIP 108903 / NRRL B-16338 / NBRC 102104 / LLR-40K-21) TaxID=446470 RepID=D3Q3Z6_STANL|nr:hypothetical protein [Stackebrandtia nassauensis]ADD45881.1 hypothetical protein Snas_6261 [Stackebrandtia nassauensis DSM 44728]
MTAQPCLRAITVRQPWAELITYARKTVENRSWTCTWRGLLAIHAGKTPEADAAEICRYFGLRKPSALTYGAIIAVARLVDVHDNCSGDCSYWAEPEAQFHWVLADTVDLRQPMNCSGKQRLWTPEADTATAVLDQLPARLHAAPGIDASTDPSPLEVIHA